MPICEFILGWYKSNWGFVIEKVIGVSNRKVQK